MGERAGPRPGPGPRDQGIPSSNGLYGIISSAIGAATTVAYGLRQQFSSPLVFSSSQESLAESGPSPESDPKSELESEPEPGPGEEGDAMSPQSDASSTRSFMSALERSVTEATGSNSARQQLANKELLRLMDRRRKLDRDFSRTQERDATALAKAREKHERELAKREAKHRREMRKLDEKREQQERKAKLRRRKTLDKNDRSTLALELERARAERDVALRTAELLQAQVGEPQAQNTILVASLGRVGAMSRENSPSPSPDPSVKSQARASRTPP